MYSLKDGIEYFIRIRQFFSRSVGGFSTLVIQYTIEETSEFNFLSIWLTGFT